MVAFYNSIVLPKKEQWTSKPHIEWKEIKDLECLYQLRKVLQKKKQLSMIDDSEIIFTKL